MKGRSSAMKVAFSAVMSALSLVFVYIGSIAPSGSWGLVAVAGLFPAAAVITAGMGAGVLSWIGVSVLGFLLVPSKLSVLIFAVLFGLYPIVKSRIERIDRMLPEILLKLVFFNISFTVIYMTMKAAVLNSLPASLSVIWILYPVGNVIFLLYDYGFSKLISLYIARVQRAIK